MPFGAGKYDDQATAVRAATKAAGVLLLVFGGAKGSGFAMQANGALTARLPEILRAVADRIEKDLRGED